MSSPVHGQVIVVTGAASGIGAALARRFEAEGAAGLVLGDVQTQALAELAQELNTRRGAPVALAQACDVSQESDLQALAQATVQAHGRIDLLCSNAGLIRDGGVLNTLDAAWQLNWQVHVMAHVWAARAVLPGMLAQGGGRIMITASAAGLLASLPSASYSVTKHASIALAESLAIEFGERGIAVSVLCPQAVDTPMVRSRQGTKGMAAAVDGVITPETLCDAVLQGLASGQFLILPHPQVLGYFQRKAQDYDRWLNGMRKLRRSLMG